MKRVFALLLAGSLALTGCGDDDKDSGEHSGKHNGTANTASRNEADVMFAQMMIPHHTQALEMTGLARTRAAGPKVKKLAITIERAQNPEIQTMTGWLKAWGVPVKKDSPHMAHGEGMMSAQDMARLKKSKGAAFDKAFLTLMIKHHQGAVTMANEEKTDGAYGPAKTMAGSIATSQTAEIATMRKLLRDL